MRARRSVPVVVAATLGTALGAAAILAFSQDQAPRLGRIDTPGGTMVVAIADTPAARSAGLSNREELRDIDGLLLKWDEAGRPPIWMAGMRFPLDLIWIDGHGRVLAVLANVPPCRVEPCPLYEPEATADAVAVLELPAGGAAKNRLTAGTVTRLADMSQRPR